MQKFIDTLKSIFGGRSVRYGANATAMTLLFVAVLVMVNVLAVRYPQRIDMTATQQFTISQQTKQILAGLNGPIEIVGYFGSQDRALETDVDNRLKEYVSASSQVSYRFIDPDRDPVAARNDNISSYGEIIVKYGDRKISANGSDEKAITGAILQATQDVQTTVYFLTGHGERTIDDYNAQNISDVRTLLEENNFVVDTINLTVQSAVPLENTVLVIADPQQELSADENRLIGEYFQNGGRLIVLSDPLSPAPLTELMATWGLAWQDDMIVDQQSQLGNPLAPAVLEYPYTDITRDLLGQASVFNSVRSIKETSEPGSVPEGVDLRVMLQSSENSSAATDFTNGQVQVQETDAVGPLLFGYAITVGDGRAVVIGDADFISNGYLTVAQANGALFRNAVAWAATQDALISLPEPEFVDRRVFLTDSQSTLVFYSSVLGLPLLFIVSGIVVWWRRR
ncbi:MAG: hypothetical protein RI985_1662 [Chloroflexota bacterium]|jgi:ABC-type uncharacterized transport system involved in gliding motility auxiliary subunit